MKLKEIFSLHTWPPEAQLAIWRQTAIVGTVCAAVLGGTAGLIAMNQSEGQSMDLHKYVDVYVNHSMNANPSQNRHQVYADAISMADRYEFGRVAVPLAMALACTGGVLVSNRKAKAILQKRDPKP